MMLQAKGPERGRNLADGLGGGPRSASLQWRLPLMISALLVTTLAAFGFLAFSEVRQSSLAAANGQLSTISSATSDAAGSGLRTRSNVLTGYARAPEIQKAVSKSATAQERAAGARSLLGRRAQNDTATFGAQLLINSDGERLLAGGATLGQIDQQMLDRLLAQQHQSGRLALGTPYAKDSTMWYWSAIPVSPGDEALGYIAELRRIRANANVDKQLKGFTGQDISMYYGAPDAEVWTTLRGVPIKPKFDASVLADTFHLTTRDGEKLIGVKSVVRDTPWFLLFTINEDAVNARATAFLQRMFWIGSALLLIAMAGAWWVSRRVTVPLKSLTTAAREIAAGNYAAREPVETADELGELAKAFNGMAQRIGESHALLGLRVEESEALARELHKASHAKSEFLAMMSHELRTPLSAIAGYAEILQLGMRGPLNEAQQADLGRIQANQVHLLRIINDILDLAQVESGKFSVNLQPVHLRDVFGDLEPIVLPLLDGSSIRYEVSERAFDLVVLAERDRLTQVLVNLVANAVRFTEREGVVSIHASQNDNTVLIHVTDTGIGISADKHEAIFQPFVQADSGAARRAQGTGLGLAISRRYAEAMGGTLTVCSTAGKGSTFTLSLRKAVATSVKETSVPVRGSGHLNTHHTTVLS